VEKERRFYFSVPALISTLTPHSCLVFLPNDLINHKKRRNFQRSLLEHKNKHLQLQNMVSSSSIFVSTAALAAAVALSSNAAPLQKRASAKRGVAWNFAETVNADIFSQGSSWTYR